MHPIDVGRCAGGHGVWDSLDDSVEILRGFEEDPFHLLRIVHDGTAMTRTRPFAFKAAIRLKPAAQSQGIALHFQGIAGVGQGVDDEVARTMRRGEFLSRIVEDKIRWIETIRSGINNLTVRYSTVQRTKYIYGTNSGEAWLKQS